MENHIEKIVLIPETENSRKKVTIEEILNAELDNVKRKRNILRFFIAFIIFTLVIYLLFGVFFGIAIVSGPSMEPALYDGDFVFFKRVGDTYSKGDIILVNRGSGVHYIKRIVAVPGDIVDFDEAQGLLVINGAAEHGEYLYFETYPKNSGMIFPLTINEGEYFILGDNRQNSEDSRTFGVIKESDIDGKTLLLFRR